MKYKLIIELLLALVGNKSDCLETDRKVPK